MGATALARVVVGGVGGQGVAWAVGEVTWLARAVGWADEWRPSVGVGAAARVEVCGVGGQGVAWAVAEVVWSARVAGWRVEASGGVGPADG
ncbi:hypothetical protein OOK31_08515 [Streptomyces sp. NBC_00249]|uniref:hypothetical protein n=1 Tax=Streptomyces sp. NBC_00249 TaxID=2975690 RepID=UPI0022518A55|nr:hypothetical protein [Streptomyces sp. NBC_00249]MCX5193938.1 hypothetical protein [Streptomyces sp. NBC_00249]